jgi:hypothetical protein
MTIKGFGNDVIGPKGKFRVELQDDHGVGPMIWSIEHIFCDDSATGGAIGSQFVGHYATQEEAIDNAKKHAGWTDPTPVPRPDRRGLVAHSRALHEL